MMYNLIRREVFPMKVFTSGCASQNRVITLWLLVGAISIGGCKEMVPTIDAKAEKARAEQVIKKSIQWIMDKDKELMYTYFVNDSSLFWFSPDNAGTIRGFDNFKELVEQVFMNPKFKGIRSDFRDMRVDLSRSGECAWWSCYLDDFNEWDGRPSNWESVRWTGVLEKIDGQWRIRQMHFSYAAEDMQAEIQKAVDRVKAGK
jgi:ketosteroid isomerase-like protein